MKIDIVTMIVTKVKKHEIKTYQIVLMSLTKFISINLQCLEVPKMRLPFTGGV